MNGLRIEDVLSARELPEGSFERFLAKQKNARKKKQTAYFSVAATVMVSVSALFFQQGEDADSIYRSYLEKVDETRMEMQSHNVSEEWLSALDNMTYESIPLYALLPEYMPSEERAMILKDHYGEIIKGVETIYSNSLKNEND